MFKHIPRIIRPSSMNLIKQGIATMCRLEISHDSALEKWQQIQQILIQQQWKQVKFLENDDDIYIDYKKEGVPTTLTLHSGIYVGISLEAKGGNAQKALRPIADELGLSLTQVGMSR